MQLRKLLPADWEWIQQWFLDDVLNGELGPVDEQWLAHVLSEEGGVQLVALHEGVPVGLAGCVWGDGKGEPHVITDIATAPALRRTGLGKLLVGHVIRWNGHPPSQNWAVYVAEDNPAAYHFFTQLGWHYCGLEDEMHSFSLKI